VSNSDLSPNTLRFLSQHIHSLEQLEVLALLHTSPSRHWTAKEVCDEIRSNLASIVQQLTLLSSQGIIEAKPGNEGSAQIYRYNPKDNNVHVQIMETIQSYQTHRIKVIEAIFRNDSGPIQGFADAFKFRRG
jgi:Fe2+ or Zn2+ uptake regulation protein